MLDKFGRDLRRLRESRKISIKDISGKTKIHKSILEKMESGDFSFFSGIHIRAFLKQYAKAIGVSSDDLLFNYEMAKNGRYSSMIKDVEEKEEEIRKVEEKIVYMNEPELPKQETLSSDKTPQEPEFSEADGNKAEDIFSIPETKEKEPVSLDNNIPVQEIKTEKQFERKPFSKSKRIKLPPSDSDYNGSFSEVGGLRIPAYIFKYIGFGLLILALIAGVYLLVDVVFLKKQNAGTEIIKQNFDDVVQENEKKILGKKSEQEIQDSIKKSQDSIRKAMIADSLRSVSEDSLTLKIVGLESGRIVVVTDTLLNKNKTTRNFSKGDKLEFKAKNLFYLTSSDTYTFDAYLNNKKLNIQDESLSKYKISRKNLPKKKQ